MSLIYMTEGQVKELLRRFEMGQCTPEEENMLLQWARRQEQSAEIQWTDEEKKQFKEIQLRQIQLKTGINISRPHSPAKRATFTYWIAAASILLILSAAGYFIFNTNNPPASIIAQQQPDADIKPGYNKAVLTLSTGENIELNNTGSETISDNNLKIQNRDGQLIYLSGTKSGNSFNPLNPRINTMSTPRGGQYQLTLSDGSRVWLNAASSITYPVVFTGNTRTVSITGEAYLEVKTNAKIPFKVNVAGRQSIDVLGTSFNINSYEDESMIKTSLIEGSVKVDRMILKPGEQSQLDKTAGNLKVTKVDTDLTIAWKNGLFNFSGASVEQVMRQLSRWYNVEVVYTGKVPVRKFGGKITRDVNLSEVISILNFNNIHAKLEGRKIIVDP